KAFILDKGHFIFFDFSTWNEF
ncbi:DUF452 domain-containing protein, partial [Campylobacter lari]|nr:DUF452 domain-containing protein [Campylobacter lari]